MIQHLKHGTASLNDLIRRQPLAQQIVTRNRAVGQINVSRVIHNASVRFFGHSLIKTPIASFHMEYWDFAALSWNHGQTAICIAQHQHGFGLHLCKHTIHRSDQIPNGVCSTGGAICTA